MKIHELVAFRTLRKERARHEVQDYTLTEDNRKGTGEGANGSLRILKHGATSAYYVSTQSCQCRDYKHRVKPELANHPDLKCKHQEMLADMNR